MRRSNFLAWVAALLLAITAFVSGAVAGSFTDAAGRVVEVPANVKRVMPAGPPAAVLLYALAPQKMAGWVRPPSADEKAFLASPYRDLPVTGRLTGKEGDADAETVRKVKPDLILDVGTLGPEYAELTDRIQKETVSPTCWSTDRWRKPPRRCARSARCWASSPMPMRWRNMRKARWHARRRLSRSNPRTASSWSTTRAARMGWRPAAQARSTRSSSARLVRKTSPTVKARVD